MKQLSGSTMHLRLLCWHSAISAAMHRSLDQTTTTAWVRIDIALQPSQARLDSRDRSATVPVPYYSQRYPAIPAAVAWCPNADCSNPAGLMQASPPSVRYILARWMPSFALRGPQEAFAVCKQSPRLFFQVFNGRSWKAEAQAPRFQSLSPWAPQRACPTPGRLKR